MINFGLIVIGFAFFALFINLVSVISKQSLVVIREGFLTQYNEVFKLSSYPRCIVVMQLDFLCGTNGVETNLYYVGETRVFVLCILEGFQA